jgi:hypothetical protein
MTDAQRAWLDAHPDYSPVGTGGASASGPSATPAKNRGVLHPDGRFEPVTRANPAPPLPARSGPSAFVVGVLLKPGESPQRHQGQRVGAFQAVAASQKVAPTISREESGQYELADKPGAPPFGGSKRLK